MWFLIAFAILGAQYQLAAGCHGGDSCCTDSNPCEVGQGDCDTDDQCAGDLLCGKDNCIKRIWKKTRWGKMRFTQEFQKRIIAKGSTSAGNWFDITDDCCCQPGSGDCGRRAFTDGDDVEITVVVRNAESNEDIADALVGFEIGNLAWQKLTDEFGEATFTMGWDDFVNGKSEFYLWVSKRNFNSYHTRKWDDVFQKIDNEDTSGRLTISLSPSNRQHGSCDCNYRPGGCKISSAAPEGFACECKLGSVDWGFGCRGDLRKCKKGEYCPGDCTDETCCRHGGGNCGGYWFWGK